MPARAGQGRFGEAPEMRDYTAAPFVDDVEAAREPDKQDQRHEQAGASKGQRAAGRTVPAFAGRRLAPEDLGKATVDVAPDLVEIRRPAAAALTPLRIVERHETDALRRAWARWRVLSGGLSRVGGRRTNHRAGEPLGQRGPQLGHARTCQRAQTNGGNFTIFVALDAGRVLCDVALVQHHDARNLIGADLGQHQVDGRNLPLAIGMRRVHDMQQQVGVHGLFQSASKSGDQIVRKVLDETHGVRNDDRFRARQLQTPQRRIERRKELVRGEALGAGQTIEQCRLAGVGVADQRDVANRGTPPRVALRLALAGDVLQSLLEQLHPRADQPPVALELRLARPPQPDAALLPLEVSPSADQPRRQVSELRELDLKLAFRALRPLGEDIENQAHPVDDPAVERFFEIALLGARQGMVEDHDVGAVFDAPGSNLLDLAAAGKKRGIRLRPAGGDNPGYGCAGRQRKRLQLVQTLGKIAFTEIDFDQQRPVAAFRTVKHGLDPARPGSFGRHRRRHTQPDKLAGRDAGQLTSRPRSANQASRSFSCGGMVMARAGTTVEMACLYTIWVTVFFKRTTYWSKDSI